MFEPVESSTLVRKTEEFFGPETPLVRAPEVGGRAYEPRPQQVAMAVRGDMLNGHAICHGGFIFTLADTAFAYACNSYNLNTVASGCAIDFLAPAREGDVLIAVGHERSASGRTGVYDIEVTNERGDKIALFRGRSYRIKGHVVEPPAGVAA